MRLTIKAPEEARATADALFQLFLPPTAQAQQLVSPRAAAGRVRDAPILQLSLESETEATGRRAGPAGTAERAPTQFAALKAKTTDAA